MKKNKFSYKILLSFIFIFEIVSLIFNLHTVSAQAPKASVNMTLSPTYVNLVTDPGKAVSSQFQVTNNNSFEEHFTLDVAKYEVGNGGEGLRIVSFIPGEEARAWVTFEEKSFMLASNQTKAVKFTVNPSKDAALGYYYAIVVHRVKEQEKGVSGAAVKGAPAFSVILEVRSPNAKRELQLVSFKTEQGVYEYLPATFDVTFKNTGNLHSIPHGDIFLDWGDKKDVAILKINEGQGNILPGATRTYTASWEDSLLLQRQNENFKIDWEKPLSKFRIGSYQANLLAVYDNGKRDVPLQSHLTFWVFPWKLIGLALLVIAAPVLFYHFIAKRKKK